LHLCRRALNERQQPSSRERQKCEMHNCGNYVDTDELSIFFWSSACTLKKATQTKLRYA
jgi:hypothetical protein